MMSFCFSPPSASPVSSRLQLPAPSFPPPSASPVSSRLQLPAPSFPLPTSRVQLPASNFPRPLPYRPRASPSRVSYRIQRTKSFFPGLFFTGGSNPNSPISHSTDFPSQMVLSRILLFKRLQCSRLNPIFLTPVSHRGFCCGFVVNPSPLCVTKGLSTLATGDTKTVEPKSLSSIFLNPSTDSQGKQTQCPSNDNTRKGKREEDKLPQNNRRSIYCPLQEKKSSMLLNPSAYSQVKKPQYLNPENSRKKMTEENKLPQVSKPFIFRSTQEKKFPKELSPGAALLLKTLCEELDLKQEPGQIPADFPSRHRLKSAAEKHGHSHQEIAKWLSGSGLKKVALFGCPSTERNTVFASKRLRSFFHIQEDVEKKARPR